MLDAQRLSLRDEYENALFTAYNASGFPFF
jgi:hypothetical protein